MAKGKNVLTTGDVAKICNVAPRTVSKWFDSGHLKGYRIPGSKDRRIPVSELMRFMKVHNMPTSVLVAGKIRVLIADNEDSPVSHMAEALQSKGDYDVRIAHSNFETGAVAQKFAPHVLLINLFARDITAVDICQNIRNDEHLQTIRVIAVANHLSESEADALLHKGFDGYICDPSDMTEVIRTIEESTAVVY